MHIKKEFTKIGISVFDNNNSCLQKFRDRVKDFVDTPLFMIVTTFLILANTVTLAMEKYPAEEDYVYGKKPQKLLYKKLLLIIKFIV